MISKQQKRIIIENPHLSAGVLSRFLGVNQFSINSFRHRNKLKVNWFHKGLGVPFLSVRISDRYSLDVYYKDGTVATTGSFKRAIKLVDHLIWCIDSGMFKHPRIEHPYLQNLKLGELK